MKWNLKTAELGDRKTVRTFAFLPTRMSDGVTMVWLEPYYEDLVYREYGYGYRPYAWIIESRYTG